MTELQTDAVVETAVSLFMFCLMTACLIQFLELCMEKNMILGKYRAMLIKLSKKSKAFEYLLKPVGLCNFCYGSWVFIIAYLNVYEFEVITLLFGLGFNYMFTELFSQWMQEKRVY